MDKYDLLQQIGDGTFGSVVKAVHKKSGQLVAVKRMKQKYYSWEECVNLPEVQVLRKLHAHPNVIKLREVVRENNELFFVFEFMDGDLLSVIRKHKQNFPPAAMLTAPPVPYSKIKSYMFQLLQALAFLHKSGYFHRDLKPENLLVKREHGQAHESVKLADFGLVKECRARPPYTDYVSTRWYRAPELLLQDRAYTCAVDIWAAGCIFTELITTKPLFPGNNEVDQLFKIMSVFGTPTEAVWADGVQLARKIRYQFPLVTGTPLRAVLPQHMPAAAVDLLSKMLVYDPKKRITAQQALMHPYFNVGFDEEPLMPPMATTAGNASRPVGGTQSAPTVQPFHTPVQWRHPGCTENKPEFGASSATKPPPASTTAAQPANRPASGSRPMFPPVDISKHSFTSAAGQYPSVDHHADSDRNVSKYFLVPTGLSPKPRDAQRSPVQPLPAASRNTPTAVQQLPKADGVLDVKASPQEKRQAQAVAVQPGLTAVKAESSSGVDLDALMSEFQNEMAAMGFQTKKEVLSGGEGAAATGASTFRSGQQPSGASKATGVASRGALKGLPSLLSPSPALPYTTETTGSSPLQKLLSSSRYKPTNLGHLTPSPHHPQQQSAALASPMQTKNNALPPPLQTTALQQTTAANRYDLESSSFASLDLGGTSSNAGAAAKPNLGGGKLLPAGSSTGKTVTSGSAISPSVNALLSKQSFKPAQLAPQTDDDDELPNWLKMVNEKTKRASPITGGAGAPPLSYRKV